MNEAIKQPMDMESEKEFSVSKTVDGITKRVSGEKVENGWVVTINKSGNYGPAREDGTKEWKDEYKKYISSKNPFADKEKIDPDMKEAEALLEGILGSDSIIV